VGRKERLWAPYTCNEGSNPRVCSVFVSWVLGPFRFGRLLPCCAWGVDGEWGYISHSQSSPFIPKSLAQSFTRVSEFSLLTTSLESMLAVLGNSGVKWGGALLSLHFTVNGAWSNGRPRNACSHQFCSTTSATTQPLISGISASKILHRAAVHALGVSYNCCVAFTTGNGSANHPCSGVSADPGYRRFTCESHDSH
jgi:hypothetical protein